MAQINEDDAVMDKNVQKDEDNLSLNEWTLLDKTPNDSIIKRNIIIKKTNVEKLIPDVEVAREVIEELELTLPTGDGNKDDINRFEALGEIESDADSAGASALSEFENKNIESQIDNIYPVDKIIPPVGTFTNIVLACLLTAVIGFGVGYLVFKEPSQFSESDVNLKNIENIKYIKRSEKFDKELDIPDVDIQSDAVLKKSEFILEKITNNNKFVDINKNNYGNNDIKSDELHQDVMEKVKFSLDIICSMIADEYKSSELNEYIATCAKSSAIINLIELKSNLQNVIMDIDYIEDLSNKRFIENMEFKLKNISLLLINDLSKFMEQSVTKIDRKLNKIRRKLNERLCLIRNTVGNDVKIQKILNKYDVLNENCSANKYIDDTNIRSDIIEHSEKKKKYIEKDFDVHPIGPEMNTEVENKNSKIPMDINDQRKKKKPPKNEQEKSHKSKRDYKSRKDLSKGDFTSERETIELQKNKVKKIHQPIITTGNSVKKSNKQNNGEEYCDTDSCSKQYNNVRKNSRDGTYDNWQFKRSEGRFNWREEKKNIGDNDGLSWEDKRTIGRRNARERY